MNGSSAREERRRQRQEWKDQRREWRQQMRYAPTSLACAIRGPITLITVGGLFALSNFTPYGIDKTWPVFLIVFGLLTLLCRGSRPVPPQPGEYPTAAPPYNYPPQTGQGAPPPAGAAAEPQGTAKGGFGTTAPPRSSDAGPTPPEGGAA